MEKPVGESTDASSIMPVSSLRSHFERMTKPASAKPISPAEHVPERSKHIELERGRPVLGFTSTVIPREASVKTQSHERESKQNALHKSISHTPERRASSRQRPVSMGPASPPRTSSIVQPQPSNDSSKPSHLPLTPSSNTLATANTGSMSPYPPAVPPSRTPNRSPKPKEPMQRPTVPVSAMQSPVTAVVHHSMPGKPSSMPPPVNRAEKPKIPSKRSIPESRSGWTALEPTKETIPDRISPFNTPPSSSEDVPEFEHSGGRPTHSLHPAKPGLHVRPDSYFPPPPVHHSVDAMREARKISVSYSARAREARDNGFKLTANVSGIPSSQGAVVTAHRGNNSLTGDPTKNSESTNAPEHRRTMPTRPHAASQVTRSSTEYLPPPRRSAVSGTHTIPSRNGSPVHHPTFPIPSRTSSDLSLSGHSRTPSQRVDTIRSDLSSLEQEVVILPTSDYPDSTRANRRPPRASIGTQQIDTKYETRLFDICGQYLCTTGYITRAWNLTSGTMLLDLSHGEREIKITAIAFKPSFNTEEEGLRVWLGSNYGDIQELDLSSQSITQMKPQAHARREIIKMYRHQDSMWSLDEDGKLHVWPPDEKGLPNLQRSPLVHRVTKGHTYSIVIGGNLWLATGKEIRIFKPGASGDASFCVIQQPLVQPNTGDVTSGAVISSQPQRVYFGHTDGKVSIYSTNEYKCIEVVNVSVYKINTLAGAGDYLWAGYNTGMIYVYDTRTQPWRVMKDWLAHDNPVLSIVVDRRSIWKLGYLQVASIGVDNAVRLWDGMLEDDWLENDMHDHDTEYCEFREITAVVATWNAGATTPSNLRYEDKDSNFFQEVICTSNPPDILVFGFQELVDLDDKRLTAKSLFKGSKKKDSTEQEHMSRQYRDWRDYLVRVIDDNMPSAQSYYLLQTANMVGLFSCVFIKSSLRTNIKNLQVTEVKRGLGGLHGNKGALILRFILNDSSLCFVNCHLAAGQSQTVHRNSDAAAILETSSLPVESDPITRIDNYVGGGDGSMIMDHEICVLNGDLNYRIDTMGRDAVVKAVKANNLPRLLERDQLLVSRKRNPGFRLRAFNELPITFAPTYKYDIGTDNYDSSEKHRSPAWCDRILYRGVGRIKQLNYIRHELRISDHRPVSGVFKMRIKTIIQKKRATVWQECEGRLEVAKRKLEKDVKIDYLVNVLGVGRNEAEGLVEI